MNIVAKIKFTTYLDSITHALDLINAISMLPSRGLIIIKPNLTNASPPPVTTPVAAAEAVYKYCRDNCSADIAIGEGCGSGSTHDVFKKTGYAALAQKYNIPLIDFNAEESIIIRNKNALVLKEFHIPRIAQDAFIISLPILKDHSFTRTTIAMKNMFGIAPSSVYGGSWNKSALHSPSTDKSVYDICLYKKPDLCVVDAVVALKGSHLSGAPTRLDTILASDDPVAVDAVGSEMLGHKRTSIEYLRLANGILGDLDNVEVIEDIPKLLKY